MKNQSAFPLRLPRSVKAEVVRRAKQDGTSVNQFVATAVAEKLAAMNTAEFFAERRARADFDAFDLIMRRAGARNPSPMIRSPQHRRLVIHDVSCSLLIGNIRAPYINKLATEGANLIRVFAEEHHSQGNCFWLFLRRQS